MPRIKVDYVVSFSSEDPEHPATTLLAAEISKKKWLGANKGESCNSIVLQLAKSSLISSVNIGTYDTAIVEVLVGRSETPNDAFKVLVLSSIFMTPMESRKGDGITKVRTFNTDQLQADVRVQKWDRVRVVCKQPYNKHIKYGLSFIHFFESDSSASSTVPDKESIPSMAPKLPSLMASRFESSAQSSDEEDAFKPGELFASMKESSQSSTESQIRQAGSSKVLKKIAENESSTLLVKTPISKDKTKTFNQKVHGDDTPRSRNRDNLLYKNDEEKPNAKIDKVVARDREEKTKEKAAEEVRKLKENVKKDKPAKLDSSPGPSKASNLPSNSDYKVKDKPRSSRDDSRNKTPERHRKEDRKRRHSGDRSHAKKKVKMESQPTTPTADPYTLMKDVVFVMSGYVNPQRGSIRDKALAMGARYKQDWGPGCTHLICAFANTPKLKQVKASDGDAVIVTGKWIEECREKQRRLPWQWFATEPRKRVTRPTSPDGAAAPPSRAGSDGGANSDEDTDDEINRVQNMKKNATPTKQTTQSPDAKQKDPAITPKKATPNGRGLKKDDHEDDSDATDIDDNSIEVIEHKPDKPMLIDSSSESDHETDVDEDLSKPKDVQLTTESMLPEFFADMCFVIDAQVEDEGFDVGLLKRYIMAYNGSVLEDPSDDSEVDVVISLDEDCDAGQQFPGAQVLSPEWVWKCNDEGMKVSPKTYSIR